jgi:hypothetical protein
LDKSIFILPQYSPPSYFLNQYLYQIKKLVIDPYKKKAPATAISPHGSGALFFHNSIPLGHPLCFFKVVSLNEPFLLYFCNFVNT